MPDTAVWTAVLAAFSDRTEVRIEATEFEDLDRGQVKSVLRALAADGWIVRSTTRGSWRRARLDKFSPTCFGPDQHAYERQEAAEMSHDGGNPATAGDWYLSAAYCRLAVRTPDARGAVGIRGVIGLLTAGNCYRQTMTRPTAYPYEMGLLFARSVIDAGVEESPYRGTWHELAGDCLVHLDRDPTSAYRAAHERLATVDYPPNYYEGPGYPLQGYYSGLVNRVDDEAAIWPYEVWNDVPVPDWIDHKWEHLPRLLREFDTQ